MRASLAVVAGFALWSVLWVGGDLVFRQLWPEAYPAAFPEEPMTAAPPLLATLVLSVLCSFLSGGLTARIAHRRGGPVWVLAILLLAVGVSVQASAWNALPLWYHLPFLLLLVPVCVLGRRLAGRPA